jgi:hypothetical protein
MWLEIRGSITNGRIMVAIESISRGQQSKAIHYYEDHMVITLILAKMSAQNAPRCVEREKGAYPCESAVSE